MYTSMIQALQNGSLPPRLQEQIALAFAEENESEYCQAAHTALGRDAGLNDDEITAARCCRATSPREQAAIRFARQVFEQTGAVTDEQYKQIRDAGFSNEEIAEIVGHVVLNLFTNYYNLVFETDIDFPPAEPLTAASQAR